MNTFLTFVIIILIIAVITQIIALYNLSYKFKQEDSDDIISQSDNKNNSRLLLLFLIALFSFFIYQVYKLGPYLLPEPASEHGVITDNLLYVTFAIIIFVFVITQSLLFYFSFKYYYRPDRKALYFPHNNKMEISWTIATALVLAILIVYGLSVWNSVVYPKDNKKSVLIELYAQQFTWTARYAGEDEKLGTANYKLITPNNPLGLNPNDKNSQDDKIVKGEFHIPVNTPVQFVFRAQDVMHSAYMPHFRAQMNCVPGMITRFRYTPTITTKEMRKKLNNPDFNFKLLCNKICGVGHYNMQMDIIVDSQEDYKKWLNEQKTFADIYKTQKKKEEGMLIAQN